jgi:hypothetical protein
MVQGGGGRGGAQADWVEGGKGCYASLLPHPLYQGDNLKNQWLNGTGFCCVVPCRMRVANPSPGSRLWQ